MYSSPQESSQHWNQCMAPLLLTIGSLSLGETSRFLMFFSSPSDLIKSRVLDESLSTTTTRILFQRESTYLLQDMIIYYQDQA